MKVMTIVGTRPELIRLSRIIALLDRSTAHVLVHTGQNWDPRLKDVFFSELGIRAPDYDLGLTGGSLGEAIGGILQGIDPVLRAERPDAVLILGDTNSALTGIVAKRLRIPLYHMEAGNRSFDANVPEEVNRRIVDAIADFNLVYSEHARRNLLAEGYPARRILLTGSPMKEVLTHYAPHIDRSRVLEAMGLREGGYIVVSAHREENVDAPERLRSLLKAVSAVSEDLGVPAVFSVHPRTRQRLQALAGRADDGDIRFSEPFGFFDWIRLQSASRCVLSDSGTITEEAALCGFPAVTIRESMERPEGLDTGSIVFAGIDARSILLAVRYAISRWSEGHRPAVPNQYQVADTSHRVMGFILGTAALSNRWHGIHESRA